MAMNKYLSVITLNVNVLNAPIKRHRIIEWIRKQNLHICCLQETHLRTKDMHRLKVRDRKSILSKWTWKKVRVSILISDKIDFKTKVITRDKEDHYIIFKGFDQQDNITPVSIYAPNREAPKYIWKILENFKKEINNNIIIIDDFSTLLSTMEIVKKERKKEKSTRILWHWKRKPKTP